MYCQTFGEWIVYTIIIIIIFSVLDQGLRTVGLDSVAPIVDYTGGILLVGLFLSFILGKVGFASCDKSSMGEWLGVAPGSVAASAVTTA